MFKKYETLINYRMNISNGTTEILLAFGSGKPFTVGKIGANELNSMWYMFLKENDMNHPYIPYETRFLFNITRQAGIYPDNQEFVDTFLKRFHSYLKDLDICAIWNQTPEFEMNVMKTCNPNFKQIELIDIEPFNFDIHWSYCLRGKKVLVISSLSKSIETQYKIKDKVWPNGLLPDFELITLPFPTMYYLVNPDKQKEYPENSLKLLDTFIDKMKEIDFDIVLVGAGAYSIPLIVEAKRIGKIGIHLGGGLQIVFGIKGCRWDNHQKISKFFNSHWKRPYPEEIPENSQIVEGSAYW
jgi:hypothetical protein